MQRAGQLRKQIDQKEGYQQRPEGHGMREIRVLRRFRRTSTMKIDQIGHPRDQRPRFLGVP